MRTVLLREAQSRIEAASQKIRTFEAKNYLTLGPIARQNLLVHYARQQEGITFSAVSNDNTIRQSMQLDNLRTEVEIVIPENNNNLAKKTKTKMNKSCAEVMVDEHSLRQALGLPLNDIFNGGVYHRCAHNETSGPDVEDEDNGASSLELQKSLPSLLLQLLLTPPRTASPSPTSNLEVNPALGDM